MPVLKANGQIEICGDFEVILNPHITVYRRPIPQINILRTEVEKANLFSKLKLLKIKKIARVFYIDVIFL